MREICVTSCRLVIHANQAALQLAINYFLFISGIQQKMILVGQKTATDDDITHGNDVTDDDSGKLIPCSCCRETCTMVIPTFATAKGMGRGYRTTYCTIKNREKNRKEKEQIWTMDKKGVYPPPRPPDLKNAKRCEYRRVKQEQEN